MSCSQYTTRAASRLARIATMSRSQGRASTKMTVATSSLRNMVNRSYSTSSNTQKLSSSAKNSNGNAALALALVSAVGLGGYYWNQETNNKNNNLLVRV